MLERVPFDETFLGMASFRLVPPIDPSDLAALDAARREEPLFASTKIDAEDGGTTNALTRLGFRRICTQVVLRVRLDGASQGLADASIADRLDLGPADVRAHAAQLDTGRFRRDPMIASAAAIDLYAAWVRNSTRGTKRIASIERNFVSFEDRNGVRWIDLLSVLDKRTGIATRLLRTIVEDARRSGRDDVKVVTDGDNIAAVQAYRMAGFAPERTLAVFHLLSANPGVSPPM